MLKSCVECYKIRNKSRHVVDYNVSPRNEWRIDGLAFKQSTYAHCPGIVTLLL